MGSVKDYRLELKNLISKLRASPAMFDPHDLTWVNALCFHQSQAGWFLI